MTSAHYTRWPIHTLPGNQVTVNVARKNQRGFAIIHTRELRRVFGPKREEEEECIMRRFRTCTSLTITRVTKSRRMI
jgi:hypothetical protein